MLTLPSLLSSWRGGRDIRVLLMSGVPTTGVYQHLDLTSVHLDPSLPPTQGSPLSPHQASSLAESCPHVWQAEVRRKGQCRGSWKPLRGDKERAGMNLCTHGLCTLRTRPPSLQVLWWRRGVECLSVCGWWVLWWASLWLPPFSLIPTGSPGHPCSPSTPQWGSWMSGELN